MQKSPYIFDVDVAGFEQLVLEASEQQPVLVDFWAEWCSPCLTLAPALERVINGHEGAILLAKIEVDDNMKLAGHYRLRGFPTVILFHRKQELGRFSGARAGHWIEEWLAEHLH
ncbi:thioredoxin family protein [Sedimenticola sp.]|uniref:thioredoxin family protein n=1 Tax=Sedimenticola sp. TaxID=1940285 RepID=UPI003D0F5655